MKPYEVSHSRSSAARALTKQLLRRIVKRLREGLTFKAHRLFRGGIAAVPKKDQIQGSKTVVSHNATLESNKEEEVTGVLGELRCVGVAWGEGVFGRGGVFRRTASASSEKRRTESASSPGIGRDCGEAWGVVLALPTNTCVEGLGFRV